MGDQGSGSRVRIKGHRIKGQVSHFSFRKPGVKSFIIASLLSIEEHSAKYLRGLVANFSLILLLFLIQRAVFQTHYSG
jgi:hypothetical protein